MEQTELVTEACMQVAQFSSKLQLAESEVAELWHMYVAFALTSQSAEILIGYLNTVVAEISNIETSVEQPEMASLFEVHLRVLNTIIHNLQNTKTFEGKPLTMFCKVLGNVHETMDVLLHILQHHPNKAEMDKRLVHSLILLKQQQKMQMEERLMFEGQLQIQFSMFNEKLQEAENNTQRLARENEMLRTQLSHFTGVLQTTVDNMRLLSPDLSDSAQGAQPSKCARS